MKRKPFTSVWRRELTRSRSLSISIVSATVFLGVWSALTVPGGLIEPLFLPPPQDVAQRFIRMLYMPYLGATLGG